MEKMMTKDELERYLYIIRNTLCGYDYSKLNNVIFFNNEVVFDFLCEIPLCGCCGSVGDALNAISAYIPVNAGGNSINLLFAANSSEQFQTLEARFSKLNKLEFLQLITQISTGAEWLYLINLCETIRMFREKEEAVVLK